MSNCNPQTLVGETRVRPPALLCAACRFWEQIKGDTLGECRIDPPQLVSGQFSSQQFWPNTDPGKWCGRHEPHPAVSPDDPNSLEGRPIRHLRLPGRAMNALSFAQINTIGQLTRQSPSFLLTLDNFGVGTLDQVRQALAAKGLHLKTRGESNNR